MNLDSETNSKVKPFSAFLDLLHLIVEYFICKIEKSEENKILLFKNFKEINFTHTE